MDVFPLWSLNKLQPWLIYCVMMSSLADRAGIGFFISFNAFLQSKEIHKCPTTQFIIPILLISYIFPNLGIQKNEREWRTNAQNKAKNKYSTKHMVLDKERNTWLNFSSCITDDFYVMPNIKSGNWNRVVSHRQYFWSFLEMRLRSQ